LALSGAGTHGTYQAGVVYGLIEKGDLAELDWDVISGNSSGALNAATYALWPRDKLTQMAEFNVDRWIKAENPLKKWEDGIHLSLFDESFYKEGIRKNIEGSLDP